MFFFGKMIRAVVIWNPIASGESTLWGVWISPALLLPYYCVFSVHDFFCVQEVQGHVLKIQSILNRGILSLSNHSMMTSEQLWNTIKQEA